jgi:glycosyltransferase involved in cell wall biosynthesis
MKKIVDIETFSIITPSYNQGRFIEKTIQSVLAQKGNFVIEYVVVDGGSKDNTLDILRKYDALIKSQNFNPCCKRLSFSYIHEKDNGPVDALKKGFRLISGEYFSWLNSDDFFVTDDVLFTVLEEFKNSKRTMVTGDGIFVDNEGRKIGLHYVKKINKLELLYLDYHILQPATFLKSDILNRYTLNSNYKCAFDLDFFTRIVLEKNDYIKIDKILAAFRMWGENITDKMCWRRYYEEQKIAFHLSPNIFYYLISCLYRFFEIVLKSKMKSLNNKSRIKVIFNKLFIRLQTFAYIKITGKGYREE